MRYKQAQKKVSNFSQPPTTEQGGHGQEAVEHQQQAPTRLYDQRGNGIRDEARLKEIVDDADNELWLVPAIALTATAGERDSDSRPSSGPATVGCPSHVRLLSR